MFINKINELTSQFSSEIGRVIENWLVIQPKEALHSEQLALGYVFAF